MPRHITLTDMDPDDIENRVSAIENNVHEGAGGLPARVQSIENWIDDAEDYPGAPLNENYNVATTLLGALVGAVNATNVRVNQHQQALINKGILAGS